MSNHYGNPVELGYLAWPEGKPERARYTSSYLVHLFWHMLGPMGWRASLRWRRMRSYHPAVRGENYVLLATNMDAAMNLSRKLFEAEK